MNFNLTKRNDSIDIISNLKDEITYGGYLVSLCSPCLIVITCLILNLHIDVPILLISFLLPLIVYSYDYYKDIDKDVQNNSVRAIYLKKKAKNYPFVFSFYVILLISLIILYSNFNLILFITMIVIGGILYNFLLKDITKRIPIFKNVYTAVTWALGGAFFPLFYYSLEINSAFILIFFLIFLRCLINVVFFDLKDIDNDKAERLKTLPVMVGKKATIKILHVLNLIAFLPLIIGICFNMINIYAIFLLIFTIYGYFYISKASSASSNELETTAHTLVDFEFLLWPLLLLGITYFI
ncbi:UbiA family prenyltransferase [Methanobacterium sp. ACI-7]|uniref:UbiA family prenyltransferase n=1 Tax=Methanobacterium sp. ACI-7 TaxID=3240853 RepID=UPI0039C19A04